MPNIDAEGTTQASPKGEFKPMDKEDIKGIWIVYDLEANREIQNLLTQKKFSFQFSPRFEALKKSNVKNKKRKTMEIWRSINELLGLDFQKYGESVRSITNQKDLIKLENAVKNKLKT